MGPYSRRVYTVRGRTLLSQLTKSPAKALCVSSRKIGLGRGAIGRIGLGMGMRMD